MQNDDKNLTFKSHKYGTMLQVANCDSITLDDECY